MKYEGLGTGFLGRIYSKKFESLDECQGNGKEGVVSLANTIRLYIQLSKSFKKKEAQTESNVVALGLGKRIRKRSRRR